MVAVEKEKGRRGTHVVTPSTSENRPVSRIVATAMARSGNKNMSAELAQACGVKNKAVLWSKMIRGSFSVKQLSKILKYCGGELTVTYANGDTEVIDI